MSVICQNFVGNTWKKDLCSNCFKSKEEHEAKKEPNNHHYLPPLTRSSAVYETVYETRNYSWAEKLSRSNSRLSNSYEKPTINEGEINGLLSSKLVNLARDTVDKPKKQKTKSILKECRTSKKEKSNVKFPDNTEPEVIGFGGDVCYSSDEDNRGSDSDDSTGSNDLTDEEKALKRLTENNTDFNSLLANLMEDSGIKPGEYKKPQFGLKRDPPKILIKPFGSSKPMSGLKVNVVAPVIQKMNERNTSDMKSSRVNNEIYMTSLEEEKELLNKRLEAFAITASVASKNEIMTEKVTSFSSKPERKLSEKVTSFTKPESPKLDRKIKQDSDVVETKLEPLVTDSIPNEDAKEEENEEIFSSEMVEYRQPTHQPLTSKSSVTLSTFLPGSPKLFTPRASFLHGTLEATPTATTKEPEETTNPIYSTSISSVSGKSSIYGEHPPRFATINGGKPAVSPKPLSNKPKPKVPVKPSNLKLILERKLSQSSSSSLSPPERTAEVPPTFVNQKSPLSSPKEPENSLLKSVESVNINECESDKQDVLIVNGIDSSETSSEKDSEVPDNQEVLLEAKCDSQQEQLSDISDSKSDAEVPQSIQTFKPDDEVSQSSTSQSISSESSFRSGHYKRPAPMPPSPQVTPPPPSILKKDVQEEPSIRRSSHDRSLGRRVSTPIKCLDEVPLTFVEPEEDSRKPRSQSLPRASDILSFDPSGQSGRYSPNNSPRRMKKMFGFVNQESRGRDLRKKGRFSLKKLLKFGNKDDMKSQDKDATRESKKCRLQIIHPLDLNHSGVEVIKRSSLSDDYSLPSSLQASPVRKTDEVDDSRPDPPPRSGGSPPERPPPPRRGAPPPTPPPPPTPSIPQTPETLYANLGHIRNSLTPKKPERTNSIKDINDVYQKRKAPQPPQSPEQEYSVPITRSQTSSENGCATPNRIQTSHYQDPGRIYSVPSYSYLQGKSLKRSESDRSMAEDSELNGSSNRWKISRLSARRSLVHRNLEDNYGAVTTANLQALAQILEQVFNHRQVSQHLQLLRMSPKQQWDEFNILSGEKHSVIGQRVFVAAQWLPCPTHVTLMLSQGSLPACIGSRGPYTLDPISSFTDLVPSDLLPWNKEVLDQLTEAHVSVLPACEVETVSEFADRTYHQRNTDPQEWDKQLCFTQLQLISALKQLQAAGIEECELEGFVLVKNLEETSADNIPRLLMLGDVPSLPISHKQSLCSTAVTALNILFQLELEDGNRSEAINIMHNILKGERATSLSQAQHILEFLLWGPSADILHPEPNEQVLSRWLDLERATVLNAVIRASNSGLSVLEEYHLLFLVRSNPKALRDAATILSPESTNI